MDRDRTSSKAPPQAGAATRKGPGIRTFSSLRNRDFRLLWAGNIFETMAVWLQLISLSWLVWELSGSALLSGTAAGLRGLPTLIIGPWAGVIADRMDRRKLVIGLQLVLAAVAVFFAFLVASGTVQVWHAMVYAIVSAVCYAFMQPARQALVVNTVPPEDLENAFALDSMAYNANRLATGVLGGLLITTVGIHWNFFVEGAAYICTALLLIPMKTPYQEVSTARESSVLTNLKDGLTYILRDNRIILHLMVLNLILNLALMPFMALLPAYTSEVLLKGANVGGYLLSSQGLGGVMGTVLIASVGVAMKKGQVALGTLVVGSAALLILAQSNWLMLSLAMLVVLGFFQVSFIVINRILVQSMIPDTLRGRVTSLFSLETGLVPVAITLTGLLMDQIGVALALTIVASVALASALFFLLTFRQVRNLE